MGKIAKGVKCSVEGCNQRAVRSVSYIEASVLGDEGLKLNSNGRRVYLCEQHYKLYKKLKKKKEKLERWRMKA